MPPPHAAARVDRRLVGRKDVLPSPLARGVGVFSRQGVRQFDAAVTFAQRAFVLLANLRQMLLQRFDDRFGQQCYAVLLPLAVAHDDL